jgi:hypothetical protein
LRAEFDAERIFHNGSKKLIYLMASEHAAELAKVKQGYESYGVQLKEALERTYDRDMGEHKEQGRREATEVIERLALLQEPNRAYAIWYAADHLRASFDLIESARAAQQEETK